VCYSRSRDENKNWKKKPGRKRKLFLYHATIYFRPVDRNIVDQTLAQHIHNKIQRSIVCNNSYYLIRNKKIVTNNNIVLTFQSGVALEGKP